MVDAAVVQRVRERRRRRYVVVVVVAGRAGRAGARAAGHAGVQPVRQRLLERGHRGRGHGGLPVIYFNEMREGRPCAVPRQGQNYCNLLHTDDIVRQVPLLWQAAQWPRPWTR